MNKTILLITLLFVPLSGCLGIPEGAIAPGDTVQITLDIYDADTGEALVVNTGTSFIVGDGDAGYGFEFERALVGKMKGFDGTITIRDDPSMQWGRIVSAQARYESALVQTIPQEQFEASFGPAVAGEIFYPQGAFFDYLVVDVDAGVVAYRPLPAEDQRDPLPAIGAILLTRVEGDQLVQILEPDVGVTFSILPPNPFNPTTPLGLSPGSYRAVDGNGEEIFFEYSKGSNPDLIGRDLRIDVTVVGLTKANNLAKGEPVENPDGSFNYGVRESPYINGVPSSTVDFGALSGDAGHGEEEHSHDEDDHTH